MYTAIVLSEQNKQKIIKRFSSFIPNNWEIISLFHMTINMGSVAQGPAEINLLGKNVKLCINSIANDEKVVAVGVETDIPSVNRKKHITLAVNRNAGAKPFLSNNLSNWSFIQLPMTLYGILKEVE